MNILSGFSRIRWSRDGWSRDVFDLYLHRFARPLPSRAQIVLKAFFEIATRWNLTDHECATLLAASHASIRRWKRGRTQSLRAEYFERISYIFGIYAGLHAIAPESPIADTWIRDVNADFGDRPPMEQLLTGERSRGGATVRRPVVRMRRNGASRLAIRKVGRMLRPDAP